MRPRPPPPRDTDVTPLQTPEPHYVPLYTGYAPQFIYRIGDTFGHCTHKLLLDPSVNHGQNLILSNRANTDYYLERPTKEQKDLIQNRCERVDPIYRHPMMAGYEGFIPRTKEKFGNRFSIVAAEGISQWEKDFLKHESDKRKLKFRSPICKFVPSNETQSNKYPLNTLRPDASTCNEIPRKFLPPHPDMAYSRHTPPHFMEKSNPDKFFKARYAGFKPFYVQCIGKTNSETTREALIKFKESYDTRKEQERAPIDGYCITPRANHEPHVIYPVHTGMLPKYRGHVPGLKFKIGRTFGANSVNAKNCTGCLY